MADFGLNKKGNTRLTGAITKAAGDIIVGDTNSAIESAKNIASTINELTKTKTYAKAGDKTVVLRVITEFLKLIDGFKVDSATNKIKKIIEGASN